MNANTEFRIIYSGCFTEPDFEYLVQPGKRTYTPKVRKLIKTAWDDARLNPDLILFNGKTISLLEASLVDGKENDVIGNHSEKIASGSESTRPRLRLVVQESDYKSFYGTNLRNPYTIPKQQLTNPLAACVVVETTEGTVFVGERNRRLAEISGLWHVPGGTLDEVINPLDFMKRELAEELNVAAEDIQSAVCLGLAENLLMQKPEFLCFFHLKLSEKELAERILTAKDKMEHIDFVFVPIEELAYFVSMHPFAPIGKAAVQRYLEYVTGV